MDNNNKYILSFIILIEDLVHTDGLTITEKSILVITSNLHLGHEIRFWSTAPFGIIISYFHMYTETLNSSSLRNKLYVTI